MISICIGDMAMGMLPEAMSNEYNLSLLIQVNNEYNHSLLIPVSKEQ